MNNKESRKCVQWLWMSADVCHHPFPRDDGECPLKPNSSATRVAIETALQRRQLEHKGCRHNPTLDSKQPLNISFTFLTSSEMRRKTVGASSHLSVIRKTTSLLVDCLLIETNISLVTKWKKVCQGIKEELFICWMLLRQMEKALPHEQICWLKC